MRGNAGRQQHNAREPKRVPRGEGSFEVSRVHGIEGSPEDAKP
jgi:hypothetical protein